MSKLKTLLTELANKDHITADGEASQHARLQIVAHYLAQECGEIICEATYKQEIALAVVVKLGDTAELGRLFYSLLEEKAMRYVRASEEWDDVMGDLQRAEDAPYDYSEQAAEDAMEEAAFKGELEQENKSFGGRGI